MRASALAAALLLSFFPGTAWSQSALTRAPGFAASSPNEIQARYRISTGTREDADRRWSRYRKWKDVEDWFIGYDTASGRCFASIGYRKTFLFRMGRLDEADAYFITVADKAWTWIEEDKVHAIEPTTNRRKLPPVRLIGTLHSDRFVPALTAKVDQRFIAAVLEEGGLLLLRNGERFAGIALPDGQAAMAGIAACQKAFDAKAQIRTPTELDPPALPSFFWRLEGGWKIFASPGAGRCAMSRLAIDGSQLTLSRRVDGDFDALMSGPRWQWVDSFWNNVVEGRTVELQLRFPGLPPREVVMARVLDETRHYVASLTLPASLESNLRQGWLRIDYDDRVVVRYDLAAAGAALDEMDKCQKRQDEKAAERKK